MLMIIAYLKKDEIILVLLYFLFYPQMTMMTFNH